MSKVRAKKVAKARRAVKPSKRRPASASRAARKANKAFAARRANAWRSWDEQQDQYLSAAMTALAGYSGAGSFGRGTARRGLAASYDAAAAGDGNARHWANSDALGAIAANSPTVRRTLRQRARYEVGNNCIARGILLTKAMDVVGRGPRIQFDTGNTEANSFLEAAFARSAKAIHLGQKLRTMVQAKTQDGEAFAMFTTNAALPVPVKADLRTVEAEQIADPYEQLPSPSRVDGIVFDGDGNPTEYHLLTQHPGEVNLKPNPAAFRSIPADGMAHWFRVDRPGQVRGIPEITPALPLMAQCRRFVLATLDAAEAAADFAILLYTEMPPYSLDDGQQVATPVTPMTSFDMERRMMTAVPAGWKASQMKAEHPATTFEMFKRSIVSDFGRCLCMPYGVASADSSQYNFSSGRLDLLPYRRSLEIEQNELEIVLLDPYVRTWLKEALLYYRDVYPRIAALGQDRIAWSFIWDKVGNGVNPADEARAREIDMGIGVTNRARECEAQNIDWEAEDERAAKGYGIPVEEYRRRLGDKMLSTGRPAAQPAADQGQGDTPDPPQKQPKAAKPQPAAQRSEQ